MRVRSIVVIASLAAVAIATGALAYLARPPAASTAVPVQARRPDDPGELLEMKREIGALRSRLGRLDPPAQPASAPVEVPPTQVTRSERREAALQQQRRAVAFLASRLGDGPRDAAWGARVQAELASSLPSGSGSLLRSVACGSVLCRAELTHPDRRALDQFAQTLSETYHPSYQLFFERDGDALATTMFLARDGQPMPNLAKELHAER